MIFEIYVGEPLRSYGFPGLEQVALGIAHQNHESLGNVHPTDTENFMRKRRLRQQKSNRIPILIKFKLIKTDFFIKS
ncbi:MAG TPA: hypothetical protein DEF48_06585 [Nostoc sp. UBA8866]|nr:hypothetical protein [Nostoc sp. UBA8866]